MKIYFLILLVLKSSLMDGKHLLILLTAPLIILSTHVLISFSLLFKVISFGFSTTSLMLNLKSLWFLHSFNPLKVRGALLALAFSLTTDIWT